MISVNHHCTFEIGEFKEMVMIAYSRNSEWYNKFLIMPGWISLRTK